MEATPGIRQAVSGARVLVALRVAVVRAGHRVQVDLPARVPLQGVVVLVALRAQADLPVRAALPRGLVPAGLPAAVRRVAFLGAALQGLAGKRAPVDHRLVAPPARLLAEREVDSPAALRVVLPVERRVAATTGP